MARDETGKMDGKGFHEVPRKLRTLTRFPDERIALTGVATHTSSPYVRERAAGGRHDLAGLLDNFEPSFSRLLRYTGLAPS